MLLLSGDDPDAFLQKIVHLLTTHIRSDVASIYLYDKASGELELRATRGLAPGSVGQVHLHLGEGLVGYVLDTLEPLREHKASRNPMFKHIVGINEEPYESFLAVPVHRGAERLGVLVAQRREEDYFGTRDALAMQALASQLAIALDNAQLLGKQPAHRPIAKPPPRLEKGRILVGGSAFGPAVHIETAHRHRRLAAGPFPKRYTLEDLQTAIEATESELAALEQRYAQDMPEMATLVFTAHQMMLMDAPFSGAIANRVRDGENPPEAIVTVAQDCMERFAAHPDPYIQDKAADVEDLAARLLNRLLNTEVLGHGRGSGHIGFARNLYPSDVVELYSRDIRGVVLAHGSDTSHVVLLLRSLSIPSMIVDRPDVFEIKEGTPVLLDAQFGNLFIDPPAAAIEKLQTHHIPPSDVAAAAMKPRTLTRDGARVHLLANINLLSETSLACKLQAEGVGLYRSEFPFLLRPAFPSEEEQVIIYNRLFQEMHGRPVTVRTLDLGGDKATPHDLPLDEDNPQLGLRSIRFSLSHPQLFHQQLRAILRGAAEASELSIMFPMVGSLEEFRAAREAVRKAEDSLLSDGLPHYSYPMLGMTVELPSVVPLMKEFAREADFFSVGTNDFVQYMLGVDRSNQTVAAYYRPEHPAVLRTISHVVKVAGRYGKDVTICGEMAHKVRFAQFFLGIGVRNFSVAPHYLPALQKILEAIDSRLAAEIARQVLRCAEARDIEAILDGHQYRPHPLLKPHQVVNSASRSPRESLPTIFCYNHTLFKR